MLQLALLAGASCMLGFAPIAAAKSVYAHVVVCLLFPYHQLRRPRSQHTST